MYTKFIIAIFAYIYTAHCAPLDNNAISNVDLPLTVENDLKASPVSVDQALSNKVALKLEETTTIATGQALFNNNDVIEDEKMFKLNDDDLIDSSYLTSSGKQANNQNGIANVQSLIDQTNTIHSNLEIMIKDMNSNNRRATASMLKLMQTNVKRLNTSLVRLNSRLNSLPIIGNSAGSASPSSSSSSAASSVPSSVSNATMQAAAQINSVVSNIRNQINNTTNEINNLLTRIRVPRPSTSNNSGKPSTPSG